MMRIIALLCGLGIVLGAMSSAEAGHKRHAKQAQHATSGKVLKHKRKAKYARVLGWRREVGGYSYSYGGSGTDYTDTTILRDPRFNDLPGPLGSDFFWDSNTTAIGSDVPYLN